MRLDVPFVPDAEYAAFLSDHADRLESVHFSLRSAMLADARHGTPEKDPAARVEETVRLLRALDGPNKYLLLNACFHGEESYCDSGLLRRVGDLLRRLRGEVDLRGVVWVDAYYLRALFEAAPDVCAGLEAVPGVNRMLDHESKISTQLEFVREAGFLPPSRIILDRALNRRPEELARISGVLARRHPGLRLGLLANEGCLPQCVHKNTHDALIALGHLPCHGDRTFPLNRDLGCLRRVLERPERLFASPFLRPEDTARMAGQVQIIKLCGRSRGPEFLRRAADAYLRGRFAGNLLSLLDALGEFEDRFFVPNDQLPADFHARLSACEGTCAYAPDACDHCSELFAGLVRVNDAVSLAGSWNPSSGRGDA